MAEAPQAATVPGYGSGHRDPRTAGWCWSAKHWRWEYRDAPGGPPDGWIHLDLIIGADWSVITAEVTGRGYPPPPAEARDIPGALLARRG